MFNSPQEGMLTCHDEGAHLQGLKNEIILRGIESLSECTYYWEL